MGYDLERSWKELARTQRKTLREDLEIIARFFGFKVKER